MGEKIGFQAVMLVFFIFFVPFLLNLFDGHVKSSKLLALSNEVQQLVSAEGEISPTVNHVVDSFSESGVIIEFVDESGSPVNENDLSLGDRVYIHYEYDNFEVQNSVIINKR